MGNDRQPPAGKFKCGRTVSGFITPTHTPDPFTAGYGTPTMVDAGKKYAADRETLNRRSHAAKSGLYCESIQGVRRAAFCFFRDNYLKHAYKHVAPPGGRFAIPTKCMPGFWSHRTHYGIRNPGGDSRHPGVRLAEKESERFPMAAVVTRPKDRGPRHLRKRTHSQRSGAIRCLRTHPPPLTPPRKRGARLG